jgi:ABC-2 type transport system permease protein
MAGLFIGTRWGLQQLNEIPFLIYVPPSLPLGALLMMLLIMTTITALASSLGTFFLSDDLEVILSSPISSLSFFTARLIYVIGTVSWMPFVFIAPVLAAMASVYSLSAWFVPTAVATFIPYFLIPAALGALLATLTMSVMNHRWTKITLRLATLAILLIVIMAIQNLATSLLVPSVDGQILRLASFLSLAEAPHLPSSWAATILSELLVPSGKSVMLRLTLLYATAVFLAGTALLAITTLHARGFSRALGRHGLSRSSLTATHGQSREPLPAPLAIIQKDLRSLSRDIAQSTQLIFLGGLCLLYLLNLKTFVTVEFFAGRSNTAWISAFFVMHFAITAFFTSAVCTRLVFTSLSLEGKNYWVLQTAPLECEDILKAKFSGWFIPISLISSILLAIGTQTLTGRWDITCLFTVLSFFVSYGMVGLGIGLGAYFADFTWEHPSQLALSLGSFTYMLSGAMLVLVNLLPASMLLRFMLAGHPTSLHLLGIVATPLVIIAINIAVTRVAFYIAKSAVVARD